MTKTTASVVVLLLLLCVYLSVDQNGPEVTRRTSGDGGSDDPSSQRRRQVEKKIFDAVIIGSGWAGVAAGRTLQKNGVKNIMILEGRDYIGGRSRTVTLEGNRLTELGSGWIHDAGTRNPIYNLAKEILGKDGIKFVTDSKAAWSDNYGGEKAPRRLSTGEFRELNELFHRKFMPYQGKVQESANRDKSLRDVANSFMKKRKLSNDRRRGLESAMESLICQEYAASLEDLSVWWWDSDLWIDKKAPDAVLLDAGGYSNLIQSYANPLLHDIELNAVVRSIDWAQSKVKISYKKHGEIKTALARNVIVTVPLGVLQNRSILFHPALPKRKLNSIDRLGNGLQNSIAMVWDEGAKLPFPSDIDWLNRVAPDGKHDSYGLFFNQKVYSGNNIVVAYLAGREAERIERLSDAETQAEAMAALRSMFGQSLPEPRDIVVSRWMKDKFSAGGYSYYKVGSRPVDRRNLGQTVGGRLFFAGEATSIDYFGYTHGAFLSGERAAIKVVKRLRNADT